MWGFLEYSDTHSQCFQGLRKLPVTLKYSTHLTEEDTFILTILLLSNSFRSIEIRHSKNAIMHLELKPFAGVISK